MPGSPSKKAPPDEGVGTKTRINPKLGTQRKTAGVRNLPKIDPSAVNGGTTAGKKKEKDSRRRSRSRSNEPAAMVNGNGIHSSSNEENGEGSPPQDSSAQSPQSADSNRQSADSNRQSAVSSAGTDLNTVKEDEKEDDQG